MDRPIIVCLCGSVRFVEQFEKVELDETLAGRIVVKVGFDLESDADFLSDHPEGEREELKGRLENLNLAKVELADELLVLNVENRTGESTRKLILHAQKHKKRIRWYRPPGSNLLGLVVRGVPGRM